MEPLITTVETNGRNSLLLLTFENLAYPNYASSTDELRCILINHDGEIVKFDDEAWSGADELELRDAGALESSGPPAIAESILEWARLQERLD